MKQTIVAVDSAWIAPDGTVTFCDDISHCTAAKKLGDETGGWKLDEDGWLHLSYGDAWVYKGEPTQAQLDTLGDIAVELAKAHPGNRSAEYISQYIARAVTKETL